MRLYCVLLFLLAVLISFAGCGDDSVGDTDSIEVGDIQVRVTDKETGEPLGEVSVNMGGEIILTDSDGCCSYAGLSFSGNIDVSVTAENYVEHKETVSLNQKLMMLDITLLPIDSPSVDILEVLEAFSEEIEALDPGKIPSIQSYLLEDYTAAADDPATAFGIFAGVIPPDHDSLPNTIINIIEKYSKLDFNFANPDVKISGNSASVLMCFEIYAETKPPEPKEWEIAVDGKLELQKHNGDWKISHWMLVSDFL